MKREFSLAEGKIWSDSLLWEKIEVSAKISQVPLTYPQTVHLFMLIRTNRLLVFLINAIFKNGHIWDLSFSFFVKQTLGISPVLFTLIQIGIKMWLRAEADQPVTNCPRDLGICSQLILTLSCSFCRERSNVALLCIYLKEQILVFQ